MPTYAYACTECSHTFDIHQPFSADSLTTCPECSGRLRKVFGAVGVTFNGSGFYRTDSRGSNSSSTGSGSSSGNSSSNSGTSSSSSESSSSSASSASATKTASTPATT